MQPTLYFQPSQYKYCGFGDGEDHWVIFLFVAQHQTFKFQAKKENELKSKLLHKLRKNY